MTRPTAEERVRKFLEHNAAIMTGDLFAEDAVQIAEEHAAETEALRAEVRRLREALYVEHRPYNHETDDFGECTCPDCAAHRAGEAGGASDDAAQLRVVRRILAMKFETPWKCKDGADAIVLRRDELALQGFELEPTSERGAG